MDAQNGSQFRSGQAASHKQKSRLKACRFPNFNIYGITSGPARLSPQRADTAPGRSECRGRTSWLTAAVVRVFVLEEGTLAVGGVPCGHRRLDKFYGRAETDPRGAMEPPTTKPEPAP
jgi:hypothetical protein